MLDSTTLNIFPTTIKKARPRPYRRRRARRFRNGRVAAAIRAFTAAKLYLNGSVPTLNAAATACGSSVGYVQAAIVLTQSDNTTLVDRVLDGRMALIAAARQVKQLATLIEAYKKASTTERAAFGAAIGPAVLWDGSLAPIL